MFVSLSPSELILLRGSPSYLPVPGDGQSAVGEQHRQRRLSAGQPRPVYYLVAGRWFSAPDFNGPWTFATPTLPAEFQRIGAEHPRARACSRRCRARRRRRRPCCSHRSRRRRKSPSGTCRRPMWPIRVSRSFTAIEKTSLLRAVNTDKDIIKVGDLLLHVLPGRLVHGQESAGTLGSRRLRSEGSSTRFQRARPPTTSPTSLSCRTDTDWVDVRHGAGYTGVTIAWGCAVWGTGWYYPPYVWSGGSYPVYYPYYPTYGYSAWYNPWVGAYERSAVAYGPYGGAGAAARYNPATGTYARGAVAWGPYGADGAGQAYNPRTGDYAQTRQGAGVYGSWGSSYVQRGDDWARTGGSPTTSLAIPRG